MLRLGLVVILLAGCARGGHGEQGKERGDCRAGSANMCDPGLLCLSNLCVRPPPADCTVVADQLASMDLGNYAEPEERAPIVAKYKAACDKAHVSKEEGECLDKAKDKWSAAQCATRMFPELASNNSGDCKKVVAKLEAAMRTAQEGSAETPQLAQWQQTIARVMKESCEQDAWPDAMKQCVLLAEVKQGADAMQTCNQQMPPALQTKLSQRLQTAMQEQNR
jgi:hypothetical protein